MVSLLLLLLLLQPLVIIVAGAASAAAASEVKLKFIIQLDFCFAAQNQTTNEIFAACGGVPDKGERQRGGGK